MQLKTTQSSLDLFSIGGIAFLLSRHNKILVTWFENETLNYSSKPFCHHVLDSIYQGLWSHYYGRERANTRRLNREIGINGYRSNARGLELEIGINGYRDNTKGLNLEIEING